MPDLPICELPDMVNLYELCSHQPPPTLLHLLQERTQWFYDYPHDLPELIQLEQRHASDA